MTNAVPTEFPAFPSYMQPVEKKVRRELKRAQKPEAVRSSIDESISCTNSCEPTEIAPVIADNHNENYVPVPCTSMHLEAQSNPTKHIRSPKKSHLGRPKLTWQSRFSFLKRRVNTLCKANKRLKKQNEVLVNALKMIQKESSINKLQLDVINDGLGEIIKNEAQNAKSRTKRTYSAKIRAFAFTVFYYSPKVYRYLCTIFTLPAPQTIQRWLENVDCQPGFLIDIIKSASSQCQLYSLAFDSMSIRKRLCVTGDNVSGWCNFGNGLETSEKSKSMASEALVFLLVPLLKHTRYPVGFFFVDKVSAPSTMFET